MALTHTTVFESAEAPTMVMGVSAASAIRTASALATTRINDSPEYAFMHILFTASTVALVFSFITAVERMPRFIGSRCGVKTRSMFEPLAWAIRKGDQDTLNWFNNYLRQIKGDGSYDRLYKKWFESNAWLNQLK